MATPGDNPTTTPTPLLQRLYETGHHSDLIVRTSTRDFHVHKCVVCEECPFFAGAVRGEWKEVQTGIIEVEEPEVVMDLLFRYMYKIDIAMVPKEGDSLEQLDEKAKRENFYLAMSVETAANKYLLAGIDGAMFAVMYNCVAGAGVDELLSFSISCVARASGEIDHLLMHSILMLGVDFKKLLASQNAWAELHEVPKLQKIVAQCATHFGDHPLAKPGGGEDYDMSWMAPLLHEASLSVSLAKTAKFETQRQMMELVHRILKG